MSADLLATRARLADDLAEAVAQADATYDAFCDGRADFGDRCYYDDRADDARRALEAFDLGAAALILALEA